MHARDNITEEIKEAARRSEKMPFSTMDKVWNRIEEKLDEEDRIIEEKHSEEIKKERRIITFRTASIAAAVSMLISLGTSYFLQKNYSKEDAPSLARQVQQIPATAIDPKPDNANNIVAANDPAPVEPAQKPVEPGPEMPVKQANKLVVKSVVPDPAYVSMRQQPREPVTARKTIRGRVTDELGDPVAGAIILARGEKQSTITDLDGNYEIEVNDGEKELFVKRLGLLPKTVAIGERALIATMLESDPGGQSDARTYEYGTSKDNLASHTDGTISDLEKAIAGKLPGVKIVRHGARNTFSADLFGVNAGGAGTTEGSPLVVIDGMFYSGTSVSLKPDEVVSLTVLKDEKAISAYGSKGTNGVIIIKTKSGKGFSEPKQTLLQKVKGIFDRKEKDGE